MNTSKPSLILFLNLCLLMLPVISQAQQNDSIAYVPYYPYLFFSDEEEDSGDYNYYLRVAVAAEDSISFLDPETSVNDGKINVSINYDCDPQENDVLTIYKIDITDQINEIGTSINAEINVQITPESGCSVEGSQSNSGYIGSFITTHSAQYYSFTSFQKDSTDNTYTWNSIYWAGGSQQYWYNSIDFTNLSNVNTKHVDYYLLGLIATDSSCTKCGNSLTYGEFLPLQYSNITLDSKTTEVRFTSIVDVNLPDPDVTGTSTVYVDDDKK